MEPHLSAPGPSVEVGVSKVESPKSTEASFSVRPETSAMAERKEGLSSGGASPSTQTIPQVTLPTPLPAPTTPVSDPLQSNSNPLVAADEDLIEREWVQKAKHIVAETRTDPYQQEKEVSKLQADYMKKRYGKEIKITSD